MWEVETGRPIGEPLIGHRAAVLGLAFSPDGRLLASSSYDGTVQLWDTESGRAYGEPIGSNGGGVVGLAFSPDGDSIAFGGYGNTVRLVPARAGEVDLCDKLTANMSHRQWRDWVSPDIDYRQTCPDLPIAPDPAGTQ